MIIPPFQGWGIDPGHSRGVAPGYRIMPPWGEYKSASQYHVRWFQCPWFGGPGANTNRNPNTMSAGFKALASFETAFSKGIFGIGRFLSGRGP